MRGVIAAIAKVLPTLIGELVGGLGAIACTSGSTGPRMAAAYVRDRSFGG